MSDHADRIEYEPNLEKILQNHDLDYPNFKHVLCEQLLKEKILKRSGYVPMMFIIEMKHVGKLSLKQEDVRQWVKLGEVRDMIRVIKICKPVANLGSQNPYLVDVSQL